MTGKKQSYNAVFGDGSYGKVVLGKMINKGGASGKIYEVEGRPESVVKIFHNVEKSATNRQKLQAMLLNKPKFDPVNANGVDYIQIAWPEALLDDEKGFAFFQKFLKETGILDELEKLEIKEGDTVRMYGLSFQYYK